MIKFLDIQAITRQHRDEYEQAISRVVESGWFLQGDETAAFEKSYSAYVGTRHCVSVASGLDALRLIIRGYKQLGIFREGDEIIVPANTYIATILAITDNNLVPVLVEPTWDNLEIDVDSIEKAITSRTRGVMIVHLYGRLAYDERLAVICRKYGLKLMEDCAQSHGCAWEGRRTGSLGDAAGHSFYPGKNLGAFGDAGAVTTDDSDLAEMVRALANYGSQRKYSFRYEGINSRMSEIDAAVLSVKLKYLDADNAHRQVIAHYYYDHIVNPIIALPSRISDERNVYHQFPVFCERRDALQAHLAECGIQTMIHYPVPPHLQECYAKAEWNNPRLSLPITERIHARELSLPINQALAIEDARIVVDALNSFKG